MFLPFKAWLKSLLFKLEKRKNSSVYIMQNHFRFYLFVVVYKYFFCIPYGTVYYICYSEYHRDFLPLGNNISCNKIDRKEEEVVTFTLWGIGQFMYCNDLLTQLWRHKFWNEPYLCNQEVFFYMIKKSRERLTYVEKKKSL